MRADAARNAEKLRVAAAALFREQGLDVPLKEIARTAGVSHGTLYNLFGGREALIDEVVVDLAAARLAELGAQALAHEDPWQGFVLYAEQTCAIQIAEPAVADVMSGRYPQAGTLMGLCHSASRTAEQVLERARAAGDLRPDFTGVDLALTFGTLAHLARVSHDAAPDAWRRTLQFVLDGLRTDAARERLPEPALSPDSVYAALGALAGSA